MLRLCCGGFLLWLTFGLVSFTLELNSFWFLFAPISPSTHFFFYQTLFICPSQPLFICPNQPLFLFVPISLCLPQIASLLCNSLSSSLPCVTSPCLRRMAKQIVRFVARIIHFFYLLHIHRLLHDTNHKVDSKVCLLPWFFPVCQPGTYQLCGASNFILIRFVRQETLLSFNKRFFALLFTSGVSCLAVLHLVLLLCFPFLLSCWCS